MSELVIKMSALPAVLELQREAFNATPYPSVAERKSNLTALKKVLLANQEQLVQAMSDDFGHRSKDDSKIGDILTSISAINYSVKRLKRWMKPERKHMDILFQPATGRVEYQPLGVIGIMVPWNYPLYLAIGPLIAALAAGNRAMLKMSELTPRTNVLLAELLGSIFSQDHVAVVGGEAEVAAAFAELPFDHLFFTGSTNVGRKVMAAAAPNLVPVTLELGGKSPAIIAQDMPLKVAVERMIWGKVLNAGQTCVAPDYILCPQGKIEPLVTAFQKQFYKMFPTISNNPDYTSIISDGHYQRLQQLLADAEQKGAKIIPLHSDLGSKDARTMPLTLVLNTSTDMLLMQEEIFGPILPIRCYDTLTEIEEYIRSQPRPLAMYIYSFDQAVQRRLLTNLHAGGACVNEAAFHVANDDLPFGGIGASGMGSYHADAGFKTFSHAKSVLYRGRLNLNKLLFPPYRTALHKLVYKLFIR